LYLDETRKTFLNLRYDDRGKQLGIELHRPQCEAGSGWILVLCGSIGSMKKHLYCLKEFHTLVPENEIQLGKIFGFYKHHKKGAGYVLGPLREPEQ
jgi:hypothetical protein